MTLNPPAYTKSEFFFPHPEWRLSDDAPDDLKKEFEADNNTEEWREFYREEYPEMEDPYYQWNGKVVDRGSSNQDEADLDGGPGSGNHGHKGVPGQVGGSAKSVANRSISDFKPKKSGYDTPEGKGILKRVKQTQDAKHEAYSRVKSLGEELKKESTPKPESEWTLEDMFDDIMGRRPSTYTEKGKAIKAELDKAKQDWMAKSDEADAALEEASQFKDRIHAEQAKNVSFGSLRPATQDDYEGFTLEKTSNSFGDDALKSGEAFIAEMSPKEYIERCAFEIFENSTLDSTMGAVSEESVQKYASMMQNGTKFDLPYLNYKGNGQEGRHRAVAAYLAGIDVIPVLIIGDPPQHDCEETSFDGGPGSGNWGHEGRPGKIGGSKDGGGQHNRLGSKKEGYTSFSKQKKKFATPHKYSYEEVKHLKPGSIIVTDDGKYEWHGALKGFINIATGQKEKFTPFNKAHEGQDVRIILPASENHNFRRESIYANDAFTEERKNNAFTTSDRTEADAVFRENTGKVWQKLDYPVKMALYAYTSKDYLDINRGLREGTIDGSTRWKADFMADAIGQCELPCDTFLYRGTKRSAFAKLLGNADLDFTEDLSKYVGIVVKDKGFLSTGTAEGTGFDDDQVNYKIYCPKGTKAIYAEPFSECGEGDKLGWDGKSTQKKFSSEFETILQRGTSLQIVGIEKNQDGNWDVECQVVSQDPVG